MEGMEIQEIGGRYRLIGPLGEGGMARVVLAFTTSFAGVSKLVVLKLLRPELASDPSFVDMFVDEARLAALLSHPNVIHTYEVGTEVDGHFLVMEYLEGQALSSVYKKMPRDRLPRDLQIHVLGELLSGLDYAHDLTDRSGNPLHIVHRDVSPQNVMITYDAQVKVLDFGIAKAISNNTATLTGTLKGKVAYISPEQALGQPVDRAADVFAVGVMLWEALAGRRISQGQTDVTLLTKRLAREEPRVRDIVPDVDPRLAEICDRAMAFDPKDRFPSCGAFRDALDAFLPASERRERTRELGQLMRQLFSDERDRQRALVEAALAGASVSVSGAFPQHKERTPQRDRTPSAAAEPTPIREQTPLANANSINPAVAAPRAASKAPWIAAAALGVAALVGLGLRATNKTEAPAASAAASAQPAGHPKADPKADPKVDPKGSTTKETTAAAQPAPTASAAPSAPTPSTPSPATPATAPATAKAKASPPSVPTPTPIAATTVATAATTAAPTNPAPPASTPAPKKGKHTIDDKDPYAP